MGDLYRNKEGSRQELVVHDYCHANSLSEKYVENLTQWIVRLLLSVVSLPSLYSKIITFATEELDEVFVEQIV